MRKYWIISADPYYYDAESAFDHLDIIDWGSRGKFSIDDIVFIYICRPKQKIGFMTRVIDNYIEKKDLLNNDFPFYGPGHFLEEKLRHHWIRLELICKASKNVTLQMMHDCGMLGNIQGPRIISGDLLALVMSAFSDGTNSIIERTTSHSPRRTTLPCNQKQEERSLEVRKIRDTITVGSKVIHKSLGEGEVTAFIGDYTKVQIRMVTGEEKTFMFPEAFLKGFLKEL